MVQGLNLLTLICLTFWTVVAGRLVMRGVRTSLLFVFPIHFLFCGLPLLFDLTLGIPYYDKFPGFADASNDALTCIVYCVYVSICPVIWWFCLGPRRTTSLRGQSDWLNRLRRRSRVLDAILLLLLCLPLVVAALSPDPEMYFVYSPFARQWHSRGTELMFHAVMVKLIQLGTLAGAAMLLRSNRLRTGLLCVGPLLVVNCWLHGKRNIVAFAIFLLVYVMWRRGLLFGRRIVMASATASVVFIVFSVYYQTNLRFSDFLVANRSYEQWIEGVRVDFGRDDVIKLNLFAELYPQRGRILEYRGESAVVAGTFFVPRWIWPGKPESYASRVMTAALGRPSPGGGTMTTNVLAESMANCSWLGLVIGPLLLVFICRLGDWCHDEVMQLLTLFIATGMMAVSFSYWAYVLVIWSGVFSYVFIKRSARATPASRLQLAQPRFRSPPPLGPPISMTRNLRASSLGRGGVTISHRSDVAIGDDV